MDYHGKASKTSTEKISLFQVLAYGSGAMAVALLTYAEQSIGTVVFAFVLGLSPVLFGIAMSVPRLLDLFTDPLSGYLSDVLRERYGRRTFVAIGSLLGGTSFSLIWLFPSGLSSLEFFFWLTVFGSLSFVGVSLISIPLGAIGSEMSLDSNERTKLMSVSSVMSTLAVLPLTWVYLVVQAPIFSNALHGGRWVGGGVGLVAGILGIASASFVRERKIVEPSQTTYEIGRATANLAGFSRAVKRVIKNRAFLCITGAVTVTMTIANAMGLGTGYIIIYYVAAADKSKAALLLGATGTISFIVNIIMTAPILQMAKRFGKKNVMLMFYGGGLVGALSQWVCFDPGSPWLILVPMLLVGLGTYAHGPLSAAMTADICDLDESIYGVRDSGMFSAAFNWALKSGISLAFVGSGVLLKMTGYDASTIAAPSHQSMLAMRVVSMGAPATAFVAGLILVSQYPLRDQQILEIRGILAERRM